MGLKWCELEEYRRAERCGDSPTNRLLQAWGQQNHTVNELFLLLWRMEHFQAMRVLKSCGKFYVNLIPIEILFLYCCC